MVSSLPNKETSAYLDEFENTTKFVEKSGKFAERKMCKRCVNNFYTMLSYKERTIQIKAPHRKQTSQENRTRFIHGKLRSYSEDRFNNEL